VTGRIYEPVWESCRKSDPELSARMRRRYREDQRDNGRWYRLCRALGIEPAMDVFGRVRKAR
jgi:hypothetical protein